MRILIQMAISSRYCRRNRRKINTVKEHSQIQCHQIANTATATSQIWIELKIARCEWSLHRRRKKERDGSNERKMNKQTKTPRTIIAVCWSCTCIHTFYDFDPLAPLHHKTNRIDGVIGIHFQFVRFTCIPCHCLHKSIQNLECGVNWNGVYSLLFAPPLLISRYTWLSP